MVEIVRPILRGYQMTQTAAVCDRLRAGFRRPLLVAVTGSGKTVMAASMIEGAVARERRVLFLAHRTELIDQASAKLATFGIRHGIIQGGRAGDTRAPVQVASVATVVRRLARGVAGPATPLDPPGALDHVDMIIVDEAHHATANTYQKIIEAHPEALVLGLTATPYRLDGTGLGDVFDCLVQGPQVAELVRLGFLVRPRVFAPPPPADLTKLAVLGGDYRMRDAESVMDRTAPIEELLQAWQRRASDRLTVGFACTVGHAEHLAAAFRVAGVAAAAIDGGTSAGERESVLARLARGELRMVWNCLLLTEGWDLPACGAVILARPTESRALYRQMVGRGLRSHPGKGDCVILDHVGACHRFGLPDEDDHYSLFGPTENGPAAVWTCKYCLTVCPDDVRVCHECGTMRPQSSGGGSGSGGGDRDDPGWQSVRERRALELEPAVPLTETQRREIYRALLDFAHARGYSDGWAAFRYRDRFSVYPPRAWREQILQEVG